MSMNAGEGQDPNQQNATQPPLQMMMAPQSWNPYYVPVPQNNPYYMGYNPGPNVQQQQPQPQPQQVQNFSQTQNPSSPKPTSSLSSSQPAPSYYLPQHPQHPHHPYYLVPPHNSSSGAPLDQQTAAHFQPQNAAPLPLHHSGPLALPASHPMQPLAQTHPMMIQNVPVVQPQVPVQAKNEEKMKVTISHFQPQKVGGKPSADLSHLTRTFSLTSTKTITIGSDPSQCSYVVQGSPAVHATIFKGQDGFPHLRNEIAPSVPDAHNSIWVCMMTPVVPGSTLQLRSKDVLFLSSSIALRIVISSALFPTFPCPYDKKASRKSVPPSASAAISAPIQRANSASSQGPSSSALPAPLVFPSNPSTSDLPLASHQPFVPSPLVPLPAPTPSSAHQSFRDQIAIAMTEKTVLKKDSISSPVSFLPTISSSSSSSSMIDQREEEEEPEVIVTTEEDHSDAEEAPKTKAKTPAKGRPAKKGNTKTPSKSKEEKDVFLDDDDDEEPYEKPTKGRASKAQPTPRKTPGRKARDPVVEEQVEEENENDFVSDVVEEKKKTNRRSKAQPTPKKTTVSQKTLEEPALLGDEEEVRRSGRVRLESPDKVRITAKTPLRKNASVDALKASGQRLMRSMKSSDVVTKPASPSKKANNGLVEEGLALEILEERRSKNAKLFREFRTGSFVETDRSSRSSRPKVLKETFPRLPPGSRNWSSSSTPRRGKKSVASGTDLESEVSFASQSVQEVLKESDGNVTEEEEIIEEDEEIIEEEDNHHQKKKEEEEEEIVTSEEEEEAENELPHSLNVSSEIQSLGKRSRSASSVDEDDGERENHEPLSKVLRVSE